MSLSPSEREELIEILRNDFEGKFDGGRRNLLIPNCPFCGHSGYKYGIRLKDGPKFGASNCFSCGRSFPTLIETLKGLGKDELIPKETTNLSEDLMEEFDLVDENEIDDELVEVEMPKGYKRTFRNPYLKSRGWYPEDYEYFEVGTNRGMDWRYNDYVIIPVIDNGVKVGYLGRHTMSKTLIDEYNDTHRRKIMRYRNSTEADGGNPFSKLLYNIDSVKEYKTNTVVLCEGVFDVIGLTRRLELYDNEYIQAVATFGKKISDVQIFKLQNKGVKTIIIGYDADATDTISHIVKDLEQYFDVYICDMQAVDGKDFDEMSVDDCYDIFASNIKTVREFNL